MRRKKKVAAGPVNPRLYTVRLGPELTEKIRKAEDQFQVAVVRAELTKAVNSYVDSLDLGDLAARGSDSLRDDLKVVLEGFDQGIFGRDTAGDNQPGWAVKILPYIGALGRLAKVVGYGGEGS